jgi:hypothetical protein
VNDRQGQPPDGSEQPVFDEATAKSVPLFVPCLDPDTDNLTAALAYAKGGRYVLPVKRGTKDPGSVVGKRRCLSLSCRACWRWNWGLEVAQITAPLRNLRLVAMSPLVNFVLMPVGTVVLARVLRLDEPLGMGLLLLGVAAGARRSCRRRTNTGAVVAQRTGCGHTRFWMRGPLRTNVMPAHSWLGAVPQPRAESRLRSTPVQQEHRHF